MQTGQIASALHFLGKLCRDGPHAEVQANPVLGPLVPADPDQAAAEHHHIFSWEVLPYRPVFLSPDMLLGASTSRAPSGGVDPEHLCERLSWIAFLLLAEAEAQEDGKALARAGARAQLEQEIADLQRWLPVVRHAVTRSGNRLYAEVLELAAEIIANLAGERRVPRLDLPPAGPDPLAGERAGLREVATWLCTPVYSGIWLSRGRMADVVRQTGLPAGFGRREDVMETLLHTAVFQGGLDPLREALSGEWRAWEQWYRAQGEDSWAERAARGGEVIARLRA